MRKVLIVVAVVVAVVAVVGVVALLARQDSAPERVGSEPAAGTAAETSTADPPGTDAAAPAVSDAVRVYFVRDEKIGVGARDASPTADTEALALHAMRELVTGPTAEESEFGLGTTIPEGTHVNGVRIEGAVASVDLSEDFASGGGSLSMLLRVAQVVCTLTQFEGVDRVAFELDGEKAEAVGGEGIIVSPPVSRRDVEGQLPAILVEDPVPGQTVRSPVAVSGSSNVFEARHQLVLTDADGAILIDEPVDATSGTGERGLWATKVTLPPLKREGFGAVTVYAVSPKGGDRTDLVEIPVRLTR